jgi:hypothetical protein
VPWSRYPKTFIEGGLMTKRILKIVVTVLVLTGTIVSTRAAWADSHDRMCKANEGKNHFSLCQTYVQPGISVVCSQYARKGAPPTAGIPVMSWECKYEGEGSSRKVVCTGGQSLPHTMVKTFTYDEFVFDSNKRCSKLCDECTSSWETWE